MSRTYDFLPNHPEIKLVQDDEMFRINTDTMVLGEFLNIYRNDTVMDMGTNNGALLLYASFFKPQKLIGLELNEKALILAKENLDNNNISNYELINEDLVTFSGVPVDVIICNPPYFETKPSELCENPYKAMAKHETTLNLKLLVRAISRNLKDNGTLFFLFLTSRLANVMTEFKNNGLNIKTLQFVYDNNKDYSNVVLIKAVKGGAPGLVCFKPIIISR